MDSSGIRLLVECYKRLQPVEGRVELAGCNDTILRLFEITQLMPYFRFCEAVPGAVPFYNDPPRLLMGFPAH
ncbi:MAG: STAS domain-containing protein [Armatimonadetes bacterium]|nr:STAS domain-containing protein [Armatimonadota bacterium]